MGQAREGQGSSLGRWAILGAIALVLLSAPLLAGKIVLLTGFTEQTEGEHRLHADIEYDLGADVLEALENGIPLRLTVEFEVIRPRAWWMDATVVSRERRFEIRYQALTRLYTIEDLDEGERESFQSHSSAMAALSRMEDLPVVPAAELEDGTRYDLRMRVHLDVREHPEGLGIVARLWSRSRISSGWYQWTLQS